MTIDYDDGGFQPPARPGNPGRRRILARGGLAVVLVGAVVAGGAYWKVQAPERARHRYVNQLVGAEAAWPAAQARIAALQLPSGWVEDTTETACSPQADTSTRCLVTNARNEKQAMDIASAMLKRAGASDHDPLMAAFKATVGPDGSHLGGCESAASVCETSLGWDGASVRVEAAAGSDLARQPVVVLLSRGIDYPQLATPVRVETPLPSDAPGVARLTGLTDALGPVTCAQRAETGAGCDAWHIVVSSGRPVAEVQRDVASTLGAHGFRIETLAPDNEYFKHVFARLYRGPHATDPVTAIVSLRLSAEGDGTTTGSVLIAGGGIYGG